MLKRNRYLKEGEVKLMVPGFNATARWNGHCQRYTRFLDFKGVDTFSFFSADIPENSRPVGSPQPDESFLDINMDAQLDLISLSSDRGWRYFMAVFKPDDFGMSSLRGIILVSLSEQEMTDFALDAGLKWYFHGGRDQMLQLVELSAD